MKPRTKAQKIVDKLYPQLPDNTIRQFMEARERVFKRKAIRYRGTCTCSECGKRFQNATDEMNTVCPHCGAELEIKAERKYTFAEFGFYHIAVAFHGWQVVRVYYLEKVCKMKSFYCNMWEIGQMWFDSKGSEVWVTASKKPFSYYQKCPYSLSGYFDIRQVTRNAGYYSSTGLSDIMPASCDIESLIHPLDYCYKHNPEGFGLYCVDELALIMLKDKFAETVFKLNPVVFKNYARHYRRILKSKKIMDALKIALRHKYDIKHFSSWLDMVEWLIELGKDHHNPFYICPENFDKAHNYWHKVVMKKREIEREKERLMEAQKKNDEYIENRKRFFPIQIKGKIDDTDIVIFTLPNVEAFYREWKDLHHCVYTCEYWNIKRHPDSLILSAKKLIGGDSIETIEVNLSRFEIIQSMGESNRPSKYHDGIMKLVNDNMELIRECAKKKPKKLAKAV